MKLSKYNASSLVSNVTSISVRTMDTRKKRNIGVSVLRNSARDPTIQKLFEVNSITAH